LFVFVGLVSVEGFVESCCFSHQFINSNSFYIFSSVNGREYYLDMWYLKGAILYSMWWFERKFFVVSVLVGLRSMSISMCQCYNLWTLPYVFIIILRKS